MLGRQAGRTGVSRRAPVDSRLRPSAAQGIRPARLRLLEVAAGRRVAADVTRGGAAVERVLPELTGKPLGDERVGAIPAVLLDAGFPLAALKGVPILARTASLIAHLLEEQSRPIGFVLSHAGAAAIDYDGPAPAGFVARDQ